MDVHIQASPIGCCYSCTVLKLYLLAPGHIIWVHAPYTTYYSHLIFTADAAAAAAAAVVAVATTWELSSSEKSSLYYGW